LRAEYRDLRTRHTVWEADGLPYLPHRALERSIETDVIIVGAGISGALTADSLTEAGMRVVIVDRRGAVLLRLLRLHAGERIRPLRRCHQGASR
jgi:NADPH-dependent 2,4-dienoyl-CoA reductase/sulfur reductase-like enzyme